MSDLVATTVASIVGSHPETDGSFDLGVWQALSQAGMHAIGVAEDRHGSGGTWQDAQAAVATAASRAVAAPLAEALFGVAPAIDAVGFDLPEGLGTSTVFGSGCELTARRESGSWRIDGVARRVPFGRQASFVVVAIRRQDDGLVAVCPADGFEVTVGTNLAGEPRDELRFVSTVLTEQLVAMVDAERLAQLRQLAGLGRAVQIAGAVDEVLAATIRYANQRVQFGRTISRFQAVAQQVAAMAGEAAVTSAAVNAAIAAVDTDSAALAIAAAKARSSASAGMIARTAHQVFGALGFTQEHSLHRLTTRLWSWRDEAGTASEWQDYLGSRAFASGSSGLWPLLTDTATVEEPASA
jgi:acyl-CoA dehydrogenase